MRVGRGRRHVDAVPRHIGRAGIAGFRDRRHVGNIRDAFLGEDRERLDLAGLDVRQRQRQRDHLEMHAVGHQVDQRRRLALVADIGELDVGGLEQLLRGEVDRRAAAGIAEIEFAGLCARKRDEVGERLGRHRRIDQRHALVPDRQPNAFEVLHRVPAGIAVERGIDQHRRARDQPGVAVRRAARRHGRADIAVGAGPVFHHDRHLPVAADLLGHGTRDDVDDAAGGVGHDDVDRPVRIVALRLRAAAEQHGGDAGGKAKLSEAKLSEAKLSKAKPSKAKRSQSIHFPLPVRNIVRATLPCFFRHCEERSDEAIHTCLWRHGLLRLQ